MDYQNKVLPFLCLHVYITWGIYMGWKVMFIPFWLKMNCPLTQIPHILWSSGIQPWSWGLRGCFSVPGQPRMDLRRTFLPSLLERIVWQDCKDGAQLSEFETFCLAAIVQLWMSSSFHQWQDNTTILFECVCITFILLILRCIFYCFHFVCMLIVLIVFSSL